jgi:hypothetical protein
MRNPWYVLMFLPLCASACGNSPLLNHETASGGNSAPSDHSSFQSPDAHTLGSCSLEFAQSGLCASLTWDSTPSTEQENEFTLRFWDKANGSAAGPYRDVADELTVQLWMPSMGHGSSPVQIASQGTGVYAVSHAYFIMPGTWEVRVQLKRNHQLLEQSVVQVKL